MIEEARRRRASQDHRGEPPVVSSRTPPRELGDQRRTGQHGRDALPLERPAARRRANSSQFQEGGHVVGLVGQGGGAAAKRDGAQRPGDQGSPHRWLEGGERAAQAVLARHLAVIGGVDDERVVRQTELIQGRQGASGVGIQPSLNI
jgi:hypothetical protein